MATAKQKQEASDASLLIKQTAEQTATALNIQYIQRDISEIKQTQKEYTEKMVTRTEFTEVVSVQADHERRTRILEESRWKIAGATGVIVGVLSIIGTYIVQLLTH